MERQYKYWFIRRDSGVVDGKTDWLDIKPNEMARQKPNHYLKTRSRKKKGVVDHYTKNYHDPTTHRDSMFAE